MRLLQRCATTIPISAPSVPSSHEIGADLSAVSEDEIRERVALLESEIVRLRDEGRRKAESRALAGTFFR